MRQWLMLSSFLAACQQKPTVSPALRKDLYVEVIHVEGSQDCLTTVMSSRRQIFSNAKCGNAQPHPELAV